MASVPSSSIGGGAPGSNDIYQSGPSTSDQWLRRWKLVFTGSGGEMVISQDVPQIPSPGSAIESYADGLRIHFHIVSARLPVPGRATIKVYNTILTTSLTDLAKQYNHVQLYVGYQKGYYGLLFDGAVCYMKRGREQNLVDTYLEVECQDGDIPYNYATVNTTLQAGATHKDIAMQAAQAMQKYGVTLGTLDGLSTTQLLRGRPLYGHAVDILNDLGAKWYIEKGQLNFYDPKNPSPGQTFNFDSASGLVGMPVVTDQGVMVTALINPTIRLQDVIHVDQSVINKVATSGEIPNVSGAVSANLGPGGSGVGYFANTSADGLYSILGIEYEGDSRDNPWYMYMQCVLKGQAIPGVLPGVAPGQQGPTESQIDAFGTGNAAP
jgi:hypothetical protein